MASLNNFENVLQTIHSKHISLPEHEVRRNNEILNKILNQIITELKSDPFFAKHYNRIFYGGSYFDGLRVGAPTEFDLDILLKVPKNVTSVLEHTNEPGYLSLKFPEPDKLEDMFKKLLDDKNYLSTEKMRRHMISIVQKATNKFKVGSELVFNANSNGTNYQLKGVLTTSGPAVTLKLKCREFNIDVDLVPCFEFPKEKWPTGGYRSNPVPQKGNFFIVPKSPKNKHPAERYWRLSFQEQERELLNGKDTLKPTLKIFKKLRDVQQHNAVASYYIKTVFLWEDEKNGGAAYWKKGTMTDTFFKMLENYIKYLESGKIPYFWNKKNNLLSVDKIHLDNMKNRLRYIEKDLKAKYQTDPLVICQYLDIKLK
ncbi:Mab-21 protein nucleotidyltransferase domain [Popillia japonica]|uniref:Mab-21 protein nucleotidyltransferase domain n=1 Tax=Popillia japonica TaxID=7064 RepID=A0AAW1N0U2_POPJA